MECIICKEDIKEEELTILECKHQYHKECIKEWCTINSSCPLCRLVINPLSFISKDITKLDLSYKILKVIPPEIFELTNLEILYLDNNQIFAIPPEIGKLINLKELNLDRNRIITIPPELNKNIIFI